MRLQALKECPGVFLSTHEREVKFTPQDWMDWLSRPDAAVFGLFDTTGLVGITAVLGHKTNPETGLMIASYIKPEYRGRGLADGLNKARIEWSKAYKGWKKVMISHRDGNEASRRAQQKHGFVFTHRESKVWPDGVVCDDICYELDLEQLRKRHEQP